MDLRSTEPFWLLKNGLLTPYPSLKSDVSCEVLVVGGGITGALMAYTLTEAGMNVVVVDKRDVGTGSTAASTAMLQYEIDVPLHQLIEQVGERIAVGSYRGCVEAINVLEKLARITGTDSGFKRKQSLYFAHRTADKARLQAEYECRQQHGFRVEWLDRKALRQRFDLSSAGAILSTDGAEVDAFQLAHGLYRTAVKKGLRVFDRTEITQTHYTDSGVQLRTATKHRIEAQQVIYCTGYEAQTQLPEKVVDLISTFALASEPFEQLPEYFAETLLWNTQDPYIYLRTTNDNRILIGGYDESFRDPQRRDALIPRKEKTLLRAFQKLYPKSAFVPDRSWAGTFGETEDGLPYIGAHPKFPRSYFALGFGGNGITFSVTAARVLCDALQGGSPEELTWYRFGR
ncbi:MAG: FAD-binding oxidoreductase [Cytophagaceae bacterium]|nr:FAD-binding oxidoreductase [Cytophagaceae bacterium]